MERKLVLSKDSTSVLICDLCRNYLSVPPISNLDGKNSCGRCNPGWPRNLVYEKLAQFMIFPCIYCDTHLQWSQVKHHEADCQRNVILCPSKRTYRFNGEYHKECQEMKIVCPFDLCYVMYDVRSIWQHFNKFHKEYVFSNTVEAKKILKEEKVWNFNPENHVCLVLCEQMPFLLFVHSECVFKEATGNITHYNYYFSVFSLCQTAFGLHYTVTLNLNSNTESSSFTMKSQEIKTFNSKLHCISFLRKGIFKSNALNFMTTKFEQLRKTENLKLSYKVVVSGSVQLQVEDYSKQSTDARGFSKTLECPICKDYLCGPIFNCNTGHSICHNCKGQMSICPFCKDFIGNSRNFILEDILEKMNIGCQNEYKGCAFVGRVNQVKLHEITCEYN